MTVTAVTSRRWQNLLEGVFKQNYALPATASFVVWRCVGPTQGAMLVGFLEYQAAQHVVEGAEAGGPPRRTGTTFFHKFKTIKFIKFERQTTGLV